MKNYLSKLLVLGLLALSLRTVGAAEDTILRAAARGNLETVKKIVDANTEAYAVALMLASQNGYLDVVKYLIEKRAEQDRVDAIALRRASSGGHLPIVKYLIEKGANVNEKANDGDTALMGASKNGHLEVVKYLIEQGARVNEKDSEGKTVLDLPLTFEIRDLLSNPNAIAELQEKGAREKLKKAGLLMLLSREHDPKSLFHEDYLPLDMAKLIKQEAFKEQKRQLSGEQ